jgi:hypothetical protein
MAKPMWKLLMTWDIRQGKESEYFEFAVREFVPQIQRLGIQPSEAWYTVWGKAPQILSGCVAESRATIDQALASDEWKALLERMNTYVSNFEYKVIPASGHFQL